MYSNNLKMTATILTDDTRSDPFLVEEFKEGKSFKDVLLPIFKSYF